VGGIYIYQTSFVFIGIDLRKNKFIDVFLQFLLSRLLLYLLISPAYLFLPAICLLLQFWDDFLRE
jgi:hypothetical protein